MKQRRTVALFFVCTVLALPVSAFDWGGLVSNETALRGRWNTGIQNTVQQTNKLTLWMRTPLPRFKNSYFTAETFYLGAYSGFDKEFSHIWDINLLKANLAFEKNNLKMNLNAGRYGISDISGLIFAQNADGLDFALETKKVSVKLYAGFTGLLNNYAVNMTESIPEYNNLEVYRLAPPIFIGSVLCRFPRLFAGQTLSAEIYGTANGKEPATFFSVSLNGPVYGSLFYIASSSLSVRETKLRSTEFANLSRFELTAFLPFFSSLLSWNTVFATGKSGNIGDFKSFTLLSANLDATVPFSGNVKTGLTASIRPIEPFTYTLSGDLFFNAMNSGAKGFSGAQWHMAARWQIFSDFQLAVSAGQFFKLPARSAQSSLNHGSKPYTFAQIKLLYSF